MRGMGGKFTMRDRVPGVCLASQRLDTLPKRLIQAAYFLLAAL